MFYVYVDWTSEDVPRPFYVGKGTATRVAETYVGRNPKHAEISTQFGLNRRIYMETESETEALREEARLTQQLKTVDGWPGNWGANLVIGGSGTAVTSPFQRLKCIHIRMPTVIHNAFKARTTEMGMSMQRALTAFADAVAADDERALTLISEAQHNTR